MEKKRTVYSDATFYSESSEKKKLPKISTSKKARPTSKIVGAHFLVAEWKSLFRYIPGRFLLVVVPFIAHFRSFLARCRSFQVVSCSF